MQTTFRLLSPAVFVLALACFALPWMDVTCQGQRVAILTGAQLATGTTISQPGMFGQSQNRTVSAEPLAIGVFFFVFIGLVTGLIPGYTAPLLPGISGAVSAIMLFILMVKLDSDAARQSQGAFRVDYQVGFWLVLVLCAAAAVLNAILYLISRDRTLKSVSDT